MVAPWEGGFQGEVHNTCCACCITTTLERRCSTREQQAAWMSCAWDVFSTPWETCCQHFSLPSMLPPPACVPLIPRLALVKSTRSWRTRSATSSPSTAM